MNGRIDPAVQPQDAIHAIEANMLTVQGKIDGQIRLGRGDITKLNQAASCLCIAGVFLAGVNNPSFQKWCTLAEQAKTWSKTCGEQNSSITNRHWDEVVSNYLKMRDNRRRLS